MTQSQSKPDQMLGAHALAAMLRQGRQCDEEGVMCIISRQLCHEAADALTAALDENDRLRTENERLRAALTWLDDVVDRNCTPTGEPARVQDEAGEWHSGPAADVCQRVLRGLQSVAQVALKKGSDK